MRSRLIVLLVLTALVAGGCGDDDTGTTAGPGDPASTTTANTQSGNADFSGFSNEECLQIAIAWSQAASLGFIGGAGDLNSTAQALADLAAQVPPDVAADFVVYASAVTAYGQALAAAGVDLSNPATYSSPQAQAALAAAGEAFGESGIVEAGENISLFLEAECSG